MTMDDNAFKSLFNADWAGWVKPEWRENNLTVKDPTFCLSQTV